MARALFVVDVQNDFTEGGALGVAGGGAVAAGITEFLHARPGTYDLVVASRDWHDATGDNGGHFALDGEPDYVHTWPAHCVADTPGAQYHPALDRTAIDVHVRKGQGVPAYSVFEGADENGRAVADVLRDAGVGQVDVAGIATDYCVRASALDALDGGWKVRILTDLVAGVAEESSAAALAELQAAGAVLADSGRMSGDR